MFVFVTGYGLRPFRILEKKRFLPDQPVQYRGQYRLPKNTLTSDGKKWKDLDFWFTDDQIFLSTPGISTVIAKGTKGELVCHSIGLNNCIGIEENVISSKQELVGYSYKAIYPDKKVDIKNVILASDTRLA